MTSKTRRPAERITTSALTANNLGTVRKLNSVLFPIKYSEKFYKDILAPEVEEFCRLTYLNDIPVGTVCCRIEVVDGVSKLYLATMGVLAPYRSRSIGSKSLQHVLDAARAHTKPRISTIYLHVQVSNLAARRFYERHGFQECGTAKDYYKKIEPRDAWILEVNLHPSESGESEAPPA